MTRLPIRAFVAKHRSLCPLCHRMIERGEEVVWRWGKVEHHGECPEAQAS